MAPKIQMTELSMNVKDLLTQKYQDMSQKSWNSRKITRKINDVRTKERKNLIDTKMTHT